MENTNYTGIGSLNNRYDPFGLSDIQKKYMSDEVNTSPKLSLPQNQPYDPLGVQDVISKRRTTEPYTPSVDYGMNSASQQAIGSGIGLAADMASQGIGMAFQNKENNAAQKEARQLANLSREDKLKQDKIDIAFKKKQQEQEEQRFQTNKRVEMYNTKFSIWETKFKQSLDGFQQAYDAAERIFAMQSQPNPQDKQQNNRSMM